MHGGGPKVWGYIYEITDYLLTKGELVREKALLPVNVASPKFEISQGDQTLEVINKLRIIHVWLFVLFIFW